MKLALYTRVSTDQQDASNQVLELTAWAERQGHTIVAEYQDVMSGARRREHLDDLFDAARRRKFELVAIWSLDRLTREGPLATLLYLQRLTAMGVRVYSHQEPYLDPSLPFYESIVAFLADVARWERVRLSELTRAGLARVRAQGKILGRPKGAKDSRKRWCDGVAGWAYLCQWADKRTFSLDNTSLSYRPAVEWSILPLNRHLS